MSPEQRAGLDCPFQKSGSFPFLELHSTSNSQMHGFGTDAGNGDWPSPPRMRRNQPSTPPLHQG